MIVFVSTMRMGSSRLPNKVTYDLAGKSAFVHVFERAIEKVVPDRVVVLTTMQASDDSLVRMVLNEGYEVFRHSSDQQIREEAFISQLDDDDIVVFLSGDGPLHVCDELPAVIDLMSNGWSYYVGDVDGTFREALTSIRAYTARDHRRRLAELRTRVICDFDLDNRMNIETAQDGTIIVQFADPILNTPWPYDPITLDYPSQAQVIREIYTDLYAGTPIKYWDVYNYLMDRPFYLTVLSTNRPIANQMSCPYGIIGLTQQIRNTVKYIEILVSKGGAYEIVGGSEGAYNKNTGRK